MQPSLNQRAESYWNIKSVLARGAEFAGRPIESHCPACGGIGWLKDEGLAGGDYPCGKLVQCPSCSEPQRRLWLQQNSGLDGKLRNVWLTGWLAGNWTGEKAQQRRLAYSAIEAAIQKRTGMLTLFGDFGGGKTHAMATVANELREQLVETYYASLAAVLDHLRSLYGQKRDTSEYWQRLLDVPCLALDEVTRFNTTDWAREKLFVLVDTRYRRRDSHLTMFATNDDPRQSLPPAEDIGYLFSRMREGTLIELRGDMRGMRHQ